MADILNTPEYQEMKKKILEMEEKDKAVRDVSEIDYAEMAKIDKESQTLVKEFLAKYGYPFISKFGKEVSQACWLFVQHNPDDKQLQNDYLKMMQDAAEPENNNCMCLLIDRIKMFAGEKQIYGSQVRQDENGKWVLYSVEDPENLNKRRAEMGMEPIEEYLKYFN